MAHLPKPHPPLSLLRHSHPPLNSLKSQGHSPSWSSRWFPLLRPPATTCWRPSRQSPSHLRGYRLASDDATEVRGHLELSKSQPKGLLFGCLCFELGMQKACCYSGTSLIFFDTFFLFFVQYQHHTGGEGEGRFGSAILFIWRLSIGGVLTHKMSFPSLASPFLQPFFIWCACSSPIEEPLLSPGLKRELAHLEHFKICQVSQNKNRFDKSTILECSLGEYICS